METRVSSHYDLKYFKNYQEDIGEFGGWANLTKFTPFLSKTDTVLDFGCGGGFLLKNLPLEKKAGIEVNPEARKKAESFGLKIYSGTDEVPDEWADVIISNHALEHTLRPLNEIEKLVTKLKPNGRIIFYVPTEGIDRPYKPNDINHHIYTWNAMCLGNLISEAGLEVLQSEAYNHRWPPKYRWIARLGGRIIFELACRIYGYLTRKNLSQVRVIARKYA
jgi:2-polyprenyl-3-methyl-5-hydroxy-6-metoxy-1,4-benzoquinol methylase